MINRIRNNIQTNYSFCDIIRKPTAKQIAFLEDRIKAPVLKDKDEYRLYYRILKAEKAMLHPELCKLKDNDENGWLRFEINKQCFTYRISAPYSEERKATAREKMQELNARK